MPLYTLLSNLVRRHSWHELCLAQLLLLLHKVPGPLNVMFWCCSSSPPVITSMQAPCSVPTNARERDRARYHSMVVQAAMRVPVEAAVERAYAALQSRLPDHFPSSTAAKKACRRGLILVDDLIAETSTHVRLHSGTNDRDLHCYAFIVQQ
jgi:hypothetical protein